MEYGLIIYYLMAIMVMVKLELGGLSYEDVVAIKEQLD